MVALHSTGSEEWTGPYAGLVLTIAAPLAFGVGLLMIPFGLLVYRKQLATRIAAMTDRPMYLARAIVALTAINFAAIGTAGYADKMGVHWGTVGHGAEPGRSCLAQRC